MKHREFITALGGALVGPLAARAQEVKLPTIGFMGPLTQSAQSDWTDAFLRRMREHGWIEGDTVAIEYRWAEGRSECFAEIAAEFVRLKVDLMVTAGTLATIAMERATADIPIVVVTRPACRCNSGTIWKAGIGRLIDKMLSVTEMHVGQPFETSRQSLADVSRAMIPEDGCVPASSWKQVRPSTQEKMACLHDNTAKSRRRQVVGAPGG
jgi:hypothetical protein